MSEKSEIGIDNMFIGPLKHAGDGNVAVDVEGLLRISEAVFADYDI
ncbi:MAG: hypothetical protein WCC17_14725 [Candidatus Nitrosopolaris sp.]